MAKSISIPITGNAAPLRRTLQNTQKDVGKFGSSVGAAFTKLGKVAAIGAGAAVAGAVALGKAAFDAAETAATSNARIAQIAESMSLFGDATSDVTDRLVGLANEQARLTGVNQNTIKESQALLLTFGNLAGSADEVGGAFDRATQLTLDMAAAGFGSATDNAKQLGKALNDPIKGISALARSGVTFTEQQKELIETLVESGDLLAAQDLILDEIENQVGGTALATANASDRIKVAFSQINEQLGTALLPAFEGLTNFVLDTVVPGLQTLVDTFEEDGLLGVLKLVGGWIVDGAKEAVAKLWDWAQAVGAWMIDTGLPYLSEKAAEWGGALWEWVTTDGWDTIKKLAEWLGAVGTWFVDTALPYLGTKAAEWAAALWEWVTTDGWDTIKKLAEWLGKVGAWFTDTALPYLKTRAEQLAAALWEWINTDGADATKQLAEWMNSVADYIRDDLGPAFGDAMAGLVDSLWSWINGTESEEATGDAAEDLSNNFANAFVTELAPALLRVNYEIYQAIVDGLGDAFKQAGKNAAKDLTGGFTSGDFGKIGDFIQRIPVGGVDLTPGFDIPYIPGLARGGPVKGNTPYIVGEQGPELFMPHTAGNIVPNHRLGVGGGVNVTVNMPAGSDGADVVRAIRRYARNTGTLPIPVTDKVRA
jgi:hypothetical protein